MGFTKIPKPFFFILKIDIAWAYENCTYISKAKYGQIQSQQQMSSIKNDFHMYIFMVRIDFEIQSLIISSMSVHKIQNFPFHTFILFRHVFSLNIVYLGTIYILRKHCTAQSGRVKKNGYFCLLSVHKSCLHSD